MAAANGSENCVRFLSTHYPALQRQVDVVLHENPVHKAAKLLQPHVYTDLRRQGASIDLENAEVGESMASVFGNELIAAL